MKEKTHLRRICKRSIKVYKNFELIFLPFFGGLFCHVLIEGNIDHWDAIGVVVKVWVATKKWFSIMVESKH
jgi:hypothetical protein